MEYTDPLLINMRTQAEEWEGKGDQRFIFLRCYTLMTTNMLKGVSNGRFADPKWVNSLLHRFADYYLDALKAYDNSDEQTPEVWRQVHDASTEERLHVLQHLLLGINAHINYDLVLALYDEIAPDWPVLSEAERLRRHADHHLVNQIIAETIDKVQDTVIEKHSPFMAVVDRLMGRVDEWLLSELITGWRGEVWNETCVMLAEESAEGRESLRQSLERKVMRKATQLLEF